MPMHTAPPTMYQTCTPRRSATGPATARPTGEMAVAMLAISVNTRPCISGATVVCKTAMSGPFVIADMTAASTVEIGRAHV